MAQITLNSWDLEIVKVHSERYGDGEVVQIKQGFNPDFVQSMRDQGVKDKPIRPEEEEESEE